MHASAPTRRCFIHLNVAILLWGITPLLVQIISLPVLPLIVMRCFIAAGTLLFIVVIRRVNLRLHRQDALLILFCGVMLAVHWTAYFLSIRLSSVAVAVVSMCSYPVITILLEPLMHREKVRVKDLITGVTVFAGVAVLIRRFDLNDQVTQGVLLGVFSALLFSLRGIISRGLVQRHDSTLVMMYQIAAAGLVLSPALFFFPFSFQHNDLLWTITLGVIFTAASHTLYISSLVALKAKTAGIMQALTPLYSAVFAALFIGEMPTLRTLIGGAIVLSAALYESLRGYK